VRIDQLMVFAWKFLLPLALINLFITGIEVLAWPNISMWFMVIINIIVMLVLVVAGSRLFKVGWGRVEVGQL